MTAGPPRRFAMVRAAWSTSRSQSVSSGEAAPMTMMTESPRTETRTSVVTCRHSWRSRDVPSASRPGVLAAMVTTGPVPFQPAVPARVAASSGASWSMASTATDSRRASQAPRASAARA